ncbi:hypothetical protein GS903_25075 [Rhodococcus hoagii]|nr:hypothetical protein [Prescottella equi]
MGRDIVVVEVGAGVAVGGGTRYSTAGTTGTEAICGPPTSTPSPTRAPLRALWASRRH